jgi:hypothetical protein
MIHLREYYEKDGKTLPGKGIALLPGQFATLVQVLPDITSLLEGKGVQIPRADYEESSSTRTAVDEDEDREDDEEEEEEEEPMKKRNTKKEAKKNYESTSEEEED